MRIVDLDLGFDLDHGVVTRFNVEPVRGPLAARLAFADRLVERIEQIPGVQSAAVTALVPLGGDALVASFHPAGRSDIPGTRPSTLSVGPALFRDAVDSASARPGIRCRRIVTARRRSRSSTRRSRTRYFGAARARSASASRSAANPTPRSSASSRDSKIDTIGEAPKSVVFYPFAQRPRRLTVIARTAGDPAATLPAFRAAIGELDARRSVTIGTLRDAASTELTMRRVGTQMVGAIGILGLLLTAIGLYGVVSYLVASRTAELGIRMALGATPGQLHREVLRHAARLVGGGHRDRRRRRRCWSRRRWRRSSPDSARRIRSRSRRPPRC